MMDVRYADEVFDDLRPSVDWLNSRKPGLGFELEDEFYASVAVVRGRPYSYAVDHTGVRRATFSGRTAQAVGPVFAGACRGKDTIVAGQSRSGKFRLKRKTAKKKYRAKVRDLKDWFRRQLTKPLPEVWKSLNAKLRGHYQYYGVNDNWPWLMKFRQAAKELAFRWLNRRSQKKSKNWGQFNVYQAHFSLALPTKLADLIAMAAHSDSRGDM